MVNTRRKESNGSLEGPVHHTRGRTRTIKQEDSGSSSFHETDSDSSGDQANRRPTSPLPPRQLRSRFYATRNYSTRSLKSGHTSISVNQRTLIYSHKMHDDSDVYEQGNDSEEEIYRVRGERTRHLLRMRRLRKRTALSLRPVVTKSYVDSHSPLPFNSDDEGNARRSRRKRNANISWLDDSQMHKVGYPNPHTGYSEEDSRDADAHNQISSRVTRKSNLRLRRQVEAPKYLFDYAVKTTKRKIKTEPELLNEDSRTDKENKTEETPNEKMNGRLRKTKTLSYFEEIDGEEGNDEEISDKKKEETIDEQVNGKIDEKDKKEQQSSDSDDESEQEKMPTTRLRNSRNKNNVMLTSNYNSRTRRPIRTRKAMRDSSSESEEENRKYSLRDRRNIAPPTLKYDTKMNNLRSRFPRRRTASSSSSDSSSSDVRRRNPPKSPHHSKNEKMKTGAGGSKVEPIKPETLDNSIRFNSIGGLDSHVQCLKEMILLPMMYPEVFRQFHIQPPRGVLFHGPPGTGKTLIARALANECSFGTRKVSFFLRKGADLLSKWIGESEKQLRLLFEQAAEMKPSIIFFDELDGLAPVRSSRQDQVHASIVSTLLALMDGLSDRGQVIVIGATNRIDAIDPALRRPGRFDRELFFPLPSIKEREEILNVHTSHWTCPPSKMLLQYLAENTVGYCGSDLRALCSEAVIQSFRRTYPQVYSSEFRLLLQPENVKVEKIDFLRAKSLLVPASHRITQGLGRKLFPVLRPLLDDTIKKALELIEFNFPHGLNTSLAKVKLSPNIRPAQLLITGNGSEHGQTSHIAPAILYKMEHIHAYMLNLVVLYQGTNSSTEEACIQIFNEARKNVPSIVYIPSIDKWWFLVSEALRAIFKSQMTNIESNIPILFLATSETIYDKLPEEIQKLFSHYRKEVLEVKPPNSVLRRLFFKPLIIDNSLKPVRQTRVRQKTPPQLPRAPTPPPTPLTEEQSRKLYETEEHTLRELRIFLRDMCKKLANNKLFFMFTKPVDTEEVPDYTNIIKQPMDLETMMTKVDFHRYECAKDFLNDIELICQNALEYNPARTSADKQIRHRACSLRDYAYTLIKTEMDTDFEEKCQEISKKRRLRKHCPSKYLPAYINTPDVAGKKIENITQESKDHNENTETLKSSVKTENKKKRRGIWRRGQIKKRIKKTAENSQANIDEKSSTESESNNENKTSKNDLCNVTNMKESSIEKTIDFSTTPLSINCDMQNSSSTTLQSPKRRLSDILSPSELLDNPLDFDDVDEALNEASLKNTCTSEPIDCNITELERVLDTTVRITEGFSMVSLLDLYNQLNRVIKGFWNTHARASLPKELATELARFKKEGALEYN